MERVVGPPVQRKERGGDRTTITHQMNEPSFRKQAEQGERSAEVGGSVVDPDGALLSVFPAVGLYQPGEHARIGGTDLLHADTSRVDGKLPQQSVAPVGHDPSQDLPSI